MANGTNQIVALTKEDFETLFTYGTLTKGSVTLTYDGDNLYFLDEIESDLINDANCVNKFVTAQEKLVWSGKQDALVSGVNIKTFGGQSILGSGDIPIGNAAQLYYSYNNGVLDFYTTNPNA